MIVALEGSLVLPSLFLGVAAASLYGLFALPLVLTYRVSRTIGFVQGGITLFSMFLYWRVVGAPTSVEPEASTLDQWQALAVVVAFGAILGGAYGWTVTGKLADWPRVRLTIYSLGWQLTLGAAVILLFMNQRAGFRASLGAPLRLPSVFGQETFNLAGVVLTTQQLTTVVVLTALTVVLTVILQRTRMGTFVRAIADDPEASKWVGVPLNLVGTGVYALAGALSALAGVFMTATIGLSFPLAIVVFLRSLTVSVVGGFMSVPLALGGCLLLGVAETFFEVDGSVSHAQREVLLMAALLLVVCVINRFRPLALIEARGQ